MATLTLDALNVNTEAPTAADLDAYAAMLAESGDPGHATDPTPPDALGEPWTSWPDWTDERWTLADAEADEMAKDFEADRRVERLGYL